MKPLKTVPKILLSAAFSAGLALSAPGVSFAAHSKDKQLSTAFHHASLAVKVKQAKMLHEHMHHVLNCLEGKDGKDFDASAGDPCKGQGNGAMNEANMSSHRKALLQQAADLARTGTQIAAYHPAHDVALAVRDLLHEAEKSSK